MYHYIKNKSKLFPNYNILEKKGMLIVEVPNEFNPLQLIAQKSLKKEGIIKRRALESKLQKHSKFHI